MAVEHRAMRPEEYPEVLRLLELCLSETREYYECMHTHFPGALSEHSRVCMVSGEIVAHVRLYERRVHLGRSVLRLGAIGDVCTHPDHRQKGYASGCLRDALGYFGTQGFHLSMAVSEELGLYGKEGWGKFPHHVYSGDPEKLRVPVRQIYHVRQFAHEEDLHYLMRIYDEYCEGRSLAVVRAPEYWRKHFTWRTDEDRDGFLIAEDEQRVVGYVRRLGKRGCPEGTVTELCYLPDHEMASFDLVEASIRSARAAQLENLSFYLPADSPPLEAIKSLSGVTEEVVESMLLRLINLRQLLWELLPELNLDLAASPTRFEGAITFKVLDQQAGVEVSHNEVSLLDVPTSEAEVISCDQSTFFKMITGYASAGELPLPGVTPGVIEVLNKLFPKGNPVFWPTDGV